MILNPSLDATNPFFEEVEKKLYEYFCKGVLLAEGRKLALGGGMIVLLSPVGILIDILKNWYKLLFLFFVWWLSTGYLAPYKNVSEALLLFGLLAILRKSILDGMQDFFKGLLILFTWGAVLKFLCRTCLNEYFFGQALLLKGNNQTIVSSFAGVLGGGFRERYDRLVDLYLQSNTGSGRDALKKFLEMDKCKE